MADAPTPCYVETAPGLAEVAWLEIRRRFPRTEFGDFLFAKDENGIVLFTYPGELADLFALHTAEAVFLTASYMDDISRGYRDLRRLRDRLIESGDLGRAINRLTRYRQGQPASYQVVVRKHGRHEYGGRDVREAVMEAVEALYPAWQGKQEKAEVEIGANVFGSNLLVGVRLPQKPAGRQQQPADVAGLRPAVAAATVLLTEPEAGDLFVDPLCDVGALLAERAHFERAHFEGAQPERVPFGPAALIAGGDTPLAAVTAAQRQTESAASVCRWQPDALPLASAAVNKIASHFPAAPGGAYGRWLGEVARVLQPGGRAVILTAAFEQFKDAIREHPTLTILGGYSTRVREQWGRIYIVRRD